MYSVWNSSISASLTRCSLVGCVEETCYADLWYSDLWFFKLLKSFCSGFGIISIFVCNRQKFPVLALLVIFHCGWVGVTNNDWVDLEKNHLQPYQNPISVTPPCFNWARAFSSSFAPHPLYRIGRKWPSCGFISLCSKKGTSFEPSQQQKYLKNDLGKDNDLRRCTRNLRHLCRSNLVCIGWVGQAVPGGCQSSGEKTGSFNTGRMVGLPVDDQI